MQAVSASAVTDPDALASGVELPGGQSGSRHLHEVLLATARAFPAVFSELNLPEDAARFDKQYATILPDFEGARIVSAERAQIARFAVLAAEQGLTFHDGASARPLAAVLAQRAEPLPLEIVAPRAAAGLVPAVRDGERRYVGLEILELVRAHRAKHWLTPNVEDAFARLLQRADAQGGKLDLRGQRFVLCGAAAELSPVELLLSGGADVLWLDVREPSAERLVGGRFAGTLSFARGGADLLREPARVAATVRRYAEAGPLHLGLYASAAGEDRPWRLTALMNALVRSLPVSAVASVSMLTSPATVAHVCSVDASAARLRAERAPSWMRALVATGSLRPALAGRTSAPAARAIVPSQGASYQAAQYLGKMLAAEAFAVYGPSLGERESKALTVSANMAPITATRSLSHPLFEAALLGAPLFDVWIAKPETTRALNGLLMLHDLLERKVAPSRTSMTPGPSSEERARAVLSKQIHGGVCALPYALDGCVQAAALVGFSKRPQLALGLFR